MPPDDAKVTLRVPGSSGALEDVDRAEDVHAGIEHRIGHRHTHVDLGCQVADHLGGAAFDQLDDRGVADVDLVEAEVVPLT